MEQSSFVLNGSSKEEEAFPKIVRLSVGGVHYETSIDTLIKD